MGGKMFQDAAPPDTRNIFPVASGTGREGVRIRQGRCQPVQGLKYCWTAPVNVSVTRSVNSTSVVAAIKTQ